MASSKMKFTCTFYYKKVCDQPHALIAFTATEQTALQLNRRLGDSKDGLDVVERK
jgi:hypothetical protein